MDELLQQIKDAIEGYLTTANETLDSLESHVETLESNLEDVKTSLDELKATLK